MGLGTRSYRRRRSRLRLSRSARRPVNPSLRSGAISKRRESRFERSDVFDSVSRELSFANGEESNRCTDYSGRRRSDRLSQVMQNRSTPSANKNVEHCEDSYATCETATGGALSQVQLVPGDDNRIVESMFGKVFDDASLLKIEVEQCVSLPELRTKPLHKFGVQKAMHLLRGNSIGSVTGHVCVGKFPVIAELPCEYEERVIEYFCSQGRDRETSKRYISTRKVYHVVNGGYEHEGRWRLIDEGEYQFSGIKWRTVKIEWQEPKVLRAISIMSSQVQKREFVVELSFLDEMVYLRRVIEDYINEHAIVLDASRPLPRGFCKEICKAYSGGTEYSNNTLRHLVSIAAKISMRTMLMLRKAIDEECPIIARSTRKKNLCEESVEILDTRVFRTLINSKTLRGAKNFLSPETTNEDRFNALYRLRHLAQEKGSYSGVDAKTLESQLDAAIMGRKSIECFRLRILRDDPWPAEMKPLLQNILQTTKIDRDIMDNRSDPDELLEPLKMKYLKCAGGEGGSRVEQYEKFVQDRLRAEMESTENLRDPDVHKSPNNHSLSPSRDEKESGEDDQELPASASDTRARNVVTQPSRASTHRVMLVPSTEKEPLFAPDTPQSTEERDDINLNNELEHEPKKDDLEQLGIEVHGISWEDYNRTVLTEQEIFDLVISDPFQRAASGQAQELNSERRISFIKFVKKVLVPGGHVFLILPQLEIPEWLEAFEDFEMKTEGTFLLLKDPEHVQRVKGKSFQNLMEVAAVARKPGRHPTRFTMDVISPYTQLPRNIYKRKAPIIDHISPPSNRLRFPGSKALVRTGEKTPALFWELMKTFCPAGGRVLDPFAATLTVGISGIQIGRSCVLLEVDQKCLELAEPRLRAFAAKRLEEEGGYEPPGASDEFESPIECESNAVSTEEQNETSSIHVQGSPEAVATTQDSADSESEQASAEDPKSEVIEDNSEATGSEENVDNAENPTESQSRASGVQAGAGVKGSSESISESERQETFPVSDQNAFNSPESPVHNVEESADEPQANERDLTAKKVPLEDNRTESVELISPIERETSCGQVDSSPKRKTTTRSGCVVDLPNTEGRPRRNRKKTSRFA